MSKKILFFFGITAMLLVFTALSFVFYFKVKESGMANNDSPVYVYREFRRAILNEDFDKALKCISEKDNYRQNFAEKEKLKSWAKNLPVDLDDITYLGGNEAQYVGENKLIKFSRNSQGSWEIEQF